MASKNNIGYQTRLFVLISCFTWILTFAFFVLQYAREREYKIESLNSKLQILNTETLNRLNDKDALSKDYLQGLMKEDSLRLTVIDFNGNVLFDTGKDNVQENHKDRKEFTDAMNKGYGYTLRRMSHMDSNEYFYSATKGDSIVVRTAVPYNNSMIQMLRVDWVYGLIIIMMALVVNVIAYFAIRRIGKTVRSLRDFATQAEAGTLDSSVTVSFPDDELGEISSHIVNMYVKQQGVMRERDESLKAVLYEEQEKVRIKHQLTNNINHEIKTPVHAIQACLETIITNKERLDDKTMSALIDKAYEHVKRLCSLLHDISIITRISEASNQISVEEVDVKSIIEEVKSDMAIYPPEKRMRLNIEMPEKVVINGNRGLLESIFRNLVDNSIAYSGGRDIFIKVKDVDQDYYEFSFADNGIGISDEHIERIFERFYRVDEGRSRKLGGTGLGLSIVKNAVQFHKGSIKVENRKSGGLQYTFTLHK